jgi:hypothetical protein
MLACLGAPAAADDELALFVEPQAWRPSKIGASTQAVTDAWVSAAKPQGEPSRRRCRRWQCAPKRCRHRGRMK